MKESVESTATADVYAGDLPESDCRQLGSPTVYVFRFQADAEPDAFSRIAMLFNIANIAPLSAAFRRADMDYISVEVALDQIRGATADLIRRKLEQLTCVYDVDLQMNPLPALVSATSNLTG